MVLRVPTPEEVAQAKLPARYEAAKTAIAECDRIDELKDLADKHAALASYARMAKDDTMRLMAIRIQERALRRAGQLLKQIEPATGAHLKSDGAVTLSRKQAATDAGLSERQRITAIRIANVPEREFESAVESGSPPTITELAMRGTVCRAETPAPVVIVDPIEVDRTQMALRAFAQFCGSHDPVSIARSIAAPDAFELRGYVHSIDGWLDQFVTHLAARA
jgi:hypothetical protein